jgi:catechol 2,3-dioxygenase-like lactoylglutathione lyase family enzyme
MKLDGFGLFVEDMPTMVRFYRDVLGFAIADPEGNLIEIGSFNRIS